MPMLGSDITMITVTRYTFLFRLAVILLLTLLLPQKAPAKRLTPARVDPVIYEGIRYVAPNDEGRRDYIEAWNVGTNKKPWELTIFTNPIDPNLEKDVQWVFVKTVDVQRGRLIVTSERGTTYQVDVSTKKITQFDSRSSPSPGATLTYPTQSKKPYRTVPPEKSMISSLA